MQSTTPTKCLPQASTEGMLFHQTVSSRDVWPAINPYCFHKYVPLSPNNELFHSEQVSRVEMNVKGVKLNAANELYNVVTKGG